MTRRSRSSGNHRYRLAACAALAAACISACSSQELRAVNRPSDDPTTTTSPAETQDPTPAALEVLPHAPFPAGCEPPFAPLASVDQYSGSTDQLPAVPGEESFRPPQEPTSVDTDGDGEPDVISPKERYTDPAVLTRGDGELRFVREPLEAGVHPLGDVDGDGRDELVVVLSPDSPEPSFDDAEYYVVPGATAPGAHDPAEVGTRVHGAPLLLEDRDGDGIREVLSPDAAGTRVLRGSEVTDPGGDARDTAPLFAVPGALLGFADLGGPLPALVTGEVPTPQSAAGVLHVADETGDRRFTTAPEHWVPSYTAQFGTLSVLVSDAGTFLALHQSDRGAARAYLWRLDDPCAPPPA